MAKILELYWLGCVVGTNERKLGKAGSHSRSSFKPPGRHNRDSDVLSPNPESPFSGLLQTHT